MIATACRTVAALMIATALSCTIAATAARARPVAAQAAHDADGLVAAAVVVYSQAPSSAGGLLQSSLLDPDGSAYDQWVWDGFTITQTQAITEIRWRGGYAPRDQGPGGPVVDFRLAFYGSILAGTQPDVAHPPLADYRAGGNAGETAAEVLVGLQTYDYRYVLPVAFTAEADTKYWVQIEAFQHGAFPDWGLSVSAAGDRRYYRKVADEGRYQLVTGDAAFELWGTPGVRSANYLYLPLMEK